MTNFMVDIVGQDGSGRYGVIRSVGFGCKEEAYDYCVGYNYGKVTEGSPKAMPRGDGGYVDKTYEEPYTDNKVSLLWCVGCSTENCSGCAC